MATINSAKRVIVAENGKEFPYKLHRVRKWNVGLKRHCMELTGEIDVTFPPRVVGDQESYRLYTTWDAAKADVERLSAG